MNELEKKQMEEYVIYEDANGFQYVKGDIGGGNTISWDGSYYDIDKIKAWDYCFLPEEMIVHFCKYTGNRITLN